MSHLDDQVSLQPHSFLIYWGKKKFPECDSPVLRTRLAWLTQTTWKKSNYSSWPISYLHSAAAASLFSAAPWCSPPPLPILDHYRQCPVGVDLQYMTVVQLRSALKLLQPAHSSVFRWFAFLNQHSLPIWTAFIPFYHFPCCVSPALFNTWLPNHCVS